MNATGFLLAAAAALLLAAALSHAADQQLEAELHSGPKRGVPKDKGPPIPGGGGFGMPGGGYGIPGWGGGGGGGIPEIPGGPGGGGGWGNMGGPGGWGAGYGGPGGGYARGGVVRPTVVCKDSGPCYGKKVICPARCFSSYSRSGKNYGYGGGGGGCTIDCKKKCTAYC